MKQPGTPATAGDEEIVCLDAPDGPLVGILTRSREGGNGAVLLCPGGWYGTMTNRNRVYVRLARELAGAGFTVLRFDWRGVGDSAGDTDKYDLDQPFVSDVIAAARYLEDHYDRDLTVVGVCFGARSALAAAPHLPNLRDLVLISFPVPKPEGTNKWTWQDRKMGLGSILRAGLRPAVIAGAFDSRMRRMYRKAARVKWRALRAKVGAPVPHKSKTRLTPGGLLEQLRALGHRGVAVLLLYGTDDLERHSFQEFAAGALGDHIARSDSLISVKDAGGELHGLGTLEVQGVVIDEVLTRVGARS